MMFGYRPDVDLDEEGTLRAFHNPELLGVRKIIRKTHFPQRLHPDPVEPATL